MRPRGLFPMLFAFQAGFECRACIQFALDGRDVSAVVTGIATVALVALYYRSKQWVRP